ncbi:acyl-CoA dehydrogenase family protein [Streptomyces sp. TS71-3]|uniref:acyl-CoA dehydrogenase family protein n=1 Tax=Streptomyces sp. TS71-3 TaxID=2733862 RepID=UPI001B12C076|nr:acyl-CoA dehydrogenase family protein [Streptomyces sp. TS71-3]GHJ42188.1 acyl-CoA dehydrogenase [Streptomyces sp. TS71-3]
MSTPHETAGNPLPAGSSVPARPESAGAAAATDSVPATGPGNGSTADGSAPYTAETTPDLLYTEEEEALRATVRRLLADRCDAAAVLARAESEAPHDQEVWTVLAADMGLAGLLVPEHLGGQGATHREVAVVLEELGRAAAPVPFLTSAVLATEALLGCLPDAAADGPSDVGSDGLGTADGSVDGAAAGLLRELAAGHTVGVLAVPLSTAPTASSGGMGQRAGAAQGESGARFEDGTLHGRITGVADALAADVLLVPTEDGLYAVQADGDGVTATARTSLDRTRPLADVALAGASGSLLTTDADGAVRRALLAGAALLASEQLGVADWCLVETVGYTRDRYQFNRPVGSFQALKHRLAQLWLETVHARAAARNAADALATGSPESPLAASLAQSYASGVAVHAAEEALQLHGGIGMTWEHPVHLYLKRAKADSIALGTAGHHRENLGALTGLTGPQEI